MKQRIFIAVIPAAHGEHLLDCAQEMLAAGTIIDHFLALIASDHALFYSEHLDLWSMGDSFDRFLRPKTQLRYFSEDSSQLYVIRRHLLRLRASPRNDEEHLLKTLLHSAKTIYKQFSPNAYLFVLRQVFDISGDS